MTVPKLYMAVQSCTWVNMAVQGCTCTAKNTLRDISEKLLCDVVETPTLREKGTKDSIKIFNDYRDTFVNIPVEEEIRTSLTLRDSNIYISGRFGISNVYLRYILGIYQVNLMFISCISQ